MNDAFIGFEDAEVEIGQAFAYVNDKGLTIELVSKNLPIVECGHSWKSGGDVGPEQLVIVVRTSGISYTVPFSGKPGELEGVGYTYYYHSKMSGKGTNSGNGARKDLDTLLDIQQIDQDVVTGTIRLQNHVKGTFTAKVCS